MKRKSLLPPSLCALFVLLLCACLPLSAQSSDQPPPHLHRHGGPPPNPLHALNHALTAPDQPPQPATPPTSAPAFFDATHLGAPMELAQGWRVGVAGQEAASPDFNDSTWAIRNSAETIADVDDSPDHGPDHDPKDNHGPHGHPPHDFIWFRLHIKLAPQHGPLALLIEVPIKTSTTMGVSSTNSDASVFANGSEVLPDGPNSSTPERYQPISRIYLLNIPANQTSLTLAVRTLHIPFGMTAYTRFFATRSLMLGTPESMNRSLVLWRDHSLFERLPRLVNSGLLIVLAMFVLTLYFTQKGHREYLWLALFELVQAPITFIDMAGSYAYIETLRYEAIFIELIVISSYLYFEFLVAFLNLGTLWARSWKRWFIYLLRITAPILAALGPLLLTLGHGLLLTLLLTFVSIFTAFWLVVWVIFCVTVLIAATLRRNYEAGLLLIPLLLSFVGLAEPVFTSGMMEIEGHPYQSPLTVYAGPIPVHFASIADFIGLLTIVLIIFSRFQRIHRERERASSELEAARSVQELMIPQEKIKTPGFEVDSVYTPAAEVGGDFFHVEPTPDGGLLVVLGDVAGKGLKAAMNVSLLIGALRSLNERSPAKILEAMNRALVGDESFTTCQAAWFGPNGELVIANAGHLPPYLNSQEIALPGGLPLGVLSSIQYDETRLYLHPGDRVLFMSDGVVEARQSSGELFGFDRIRNLSNQSAFYIADAAREFGQEDDITVLTVRRVAQTTAAA